ncbi:MAG: glycosyltransferase family 2 protein [Acidobacteria bacterium]|nr:glycosyltransferase family 2 protein [Acidobacteriota bacterium]MBI3655682.1 glycosyltransferase family 2 protein [Acidobacteriota bacterium]
MARRISITPVYNEEEVIVRVLTEIRQHVDYMIIVNDGSSDSSKEKILDWKKNNTGIYFISSEKNEGCSVALKRGYALVTHLFETRQLEKDDLIIELDSDGQHDPAYIAGLFELWEKNTDIDIVLAQRDFSNYPFYKLFGNRGLTFIASLLAGYRYNDVESNFRVAPAYLFSKLLKYYTGYRYSAAFEIGIIFGHLKLKTDNNYVVKVPYYRPRSRASDGFHIVATGLYTWLRLKMGIENKNTRSFVEETVRRLVP